MELKSWALETCVATDTYFGRIPRDIVRLIDYYISGPVRLDISRSINQKVLDIYEDRILTRDDSLRNCIYDIRGTLLSQWEQDWGTIATIVGKEEVVISCYRDDGIMLYNFITGVRRPIELHNKLPPEGSEVIHVRPYTEVYYYNGQLWRGEDPGLIVKPNLHRYFLMATKMIPFQDKLVEKFPPGLEVVMGYDYYYLHFREQHIAVKCYCAALDGIMFVLNHHNKLQCVNWGGKIEDVDCTVSDSYMLHAHGVFALVISRKSSSDVPTISFARLWI